MSRQWSHLEALVQCQGNGPMSRHWSNVEALVLCRGIGPTGCPELLEFQGIPQISLNLITLDYIIRNP